MRVGMMMRDTEYRDAMIEVMSGFDKDIFIEVAGPSGVSRESVILTDILPQEIESKSLNKIRQRTVFLSPVPVSAAMRRSGKGAVGAGSDDSDAASGDKDNLCCVVFKYSSILEIMAELSYVYSMWSGDTGSISPATRIIAVTGESDSLSSERCRSLAKQIIYRHGGSVIILPLGYINDYRSDTDTGDKGWFRRLMYMIDEGTDYKADSFTYTDSYGASFLRLPEGRNPLADLTGDYVCKLIKSIGCHFDTVILDTGTCYSSRNIRVIRSADNILFFGTGRRIRDISAFISSCDQSDIEEADDRTASRIRRISVSDSSAEALGIDDFVKDTYGSADQKTNNT